MQIQTLHCRQGDIHPLVPAHIFTSYQSDCSHADFEQAQQTHHILLENILPTWSVGTMLVNDGTAQFKIVGRILQTHTRHARYSPLLCSLETVPAQTMHVTFEKSNYSLAWITLSDKGAVGLRNDTAGPCIEETLKEALPLCHSQGFILPDDPLALRALVTELSLGQGYDIICTTGGTGLSERDQTPEAMVPILDSRLHGFEQAMLLASLQKTPHAMLSRAVVGTIKTTFGSTLCINLPGSLKAVQENLNAILPAMDHALKKLGGDTGDCGR